MAIQVRRSLSFRGNLEEAITRITTELNPPLLAGEPMLSSYTENGEIKYLYAVGTGSGNIKIMPSFDDEDELIKYIQSYAQPFNPANVSSESDVIIEEDSSSKLVFKLKDEFRDGIKNIWINLNE